MIRIPEESFSAAAAGEDFQKIPKNFFKIYFAVLDKITIFVVPKINRVMKIKVITNYKGRYCAELENGEYILSNGSMELIRCEKVAEGMKVTESGIVAGFMMKSDEDFRKAVEAL